MSALNNSPAGAYAGTIAPFQGGGSAGYNQFGAQGLYAFIPVVPDLAESITGINNHTTMVGTATTIAGNTDGWIYNPGAGGTITLLNDPNATSTDPTGINDNGDVVGYYISSADGSVNGFIYSGGTYTTVDDPGASGTYLTGINNLDYITGYQEVTIPHDGNLYDYVGFIGSPPGLTYSGGYFSDANFPGPFTVTSQFESLTAAPEPSSLALMAGAATVLGLLRRRRSVGASV